MAVALPTDLVFATTNRHKLTEAREILAPLGILVRSAAEVGGLPEVVEDGDSFAANAIKKAVSACKATGLWALADDSGIEARALGWEPGIYSARYAGEPCDDGANNRKLTAELRSHSDRHVQYRCVIALARPGCVPRTWDGLFAGVWIDEARGHGGFGYDPQVLLPDLGKTVAEIPADEKHARSHRGQALRACVAWLRSLA